MNSDNLTTIVYVPSEIENEPSLQQQIEIAKERNQGFNAGKQLVGKTLQWTPIQESEKTLQQTPIQELGKTLQQTPNQELEKPLQWISIQEPVTEESVAEQMRVYRPEECLLVAATDHTIICARKWNLAVVGYLNPDITGQSLKGVDFLVEGFEEIDDAYLTRIWQRHHGIPWTIFATERCMVRELCLDDMKALFELYAQPGMTEYMEELYPWEEELEYERAYIENMYRLYEYGMWLVFDKVTGELIGRAGLEHRPYPEEGEDAHAQGFTEPKMSLEQSVDVEQNEKVMQSVDAEQNEDAVQSVDTEQNESVDAEPNEYMDQGSSWDSVPTDSQHLELEMGYAIASSRWHQGYATEVCTGIIEYAKEHLDYKRINCLIQRENQNSIALMEKLGFHFVEETELTGERMLRYVLRL